MLMPVQLLSETLVLSGLGPGLSPKSQIKKSGTMPISDAAFAKKLMRSIVVAAVVRDNQKVPVWSASEVVASRRSDVYPAS